MKKGEIMENFVFYSPTKFIFGINEEENVGKYIKEFGGSKIPGMGTPHGLARPL